MLSKHYLLLSAFYMYALRCTMTQALPATCTLFTLCSTIYPTCILTRQYLLLSALYPLCCTIYPSSTSYSPHSMLCALRSIPKHYLPSSTLSEVYEVDGNVSLQHVGGDWSLKRRLVELYENFYANLGCMKRAPVGLIHR